MSAISSASYDATIASVTDSPVVSRMALSLGINSNDTIHILRRVVAVSDGISVTSEPSSLLCKGWFVLGAPRPVGFARPSPVEELPLVDADARGVAARHTPERFRAEVASVEVLVRW